MLVFDNVVVVFVENALVLDCFKLFDELNERGCVLQLLQIVSLLVVC
jgi:hypothetical protein